MPTFELVTSTVLTSATATITFSSIPQTYTDLYVKGYMRNTSASFMNNYSIRLNNETNSSAFNTLYSNQTAGSFQVTGQNNVAIQATYNLVAAANAFTGGNGVTQNSLYITNYSSSLNNKAYFYHNCCVTDSGTNQFPSMTFGVYQNTTAISRLDFIDSTGQTFAVGTAIYIYGIKAVV